MAVFKFIDLFAGIGGFRLAGEANGGECVFSAEIDQRAAEAYTSNFGPDPLADVTTIAASDIPGHDVLFAGFPCQPFSISGFKRGFDDTRGTLFFDVLRILRESRPSCVVLENVKHFAAHDGGRTLATIVTCLEELGYLVSVSVVNAADFGLAQNRERTIIVASLHVQFDFSLLQRAPRRKISEILETDGDFEFVAPEAYTLLDSDFVRTQEKTGLRFVGYRNKNIRKAGVRPGTEHLSRVHKQPNRIYCSSGTHPTLSAGESSGRYFILHEGAVRKLTMRECFRLQGFPDTFSIHRSLSAAYKQIGNSVPVPMISEVVRSAIEQGLLRHRISEAA